MQPNSLWLTLTGLAGLLCVAIQAVKAMRARRAEPSRASPEVVAIVWFGATVAANLVMLMFYYWSRLDEPIASRFALPSCFVLSIAAGWLAHSLDLRWIPATRLLGVGLAAWVLVFAAPAYAHRFYTSQNMVMHELEWEIEQVAARPRSTLLSTSKATLPFLIRKIPAVNTVLARGRGAQIAWHMRQGTFREVVVSQVLRPTSARGDLIVDPDDVFPENFRLQTMVEKRFGGRWIRISRLEEVVPVEVSAPVVHAAETPP
jgi:hypothetical protein